MLYPGQPPKMLQRVCQTLYQLTQGTTYSNYRFHQINNTTQSNTQFEFSNTLDRNGVTKYIVSKLLWTPTYSKYPTGASICDKPRLALYTPLTRSIPLEPPFVINLGSVHPPYSKNPTGASICNKPGGGGGNPRCGGSYASTTDSYTNYL